MTANLFLFINGEWISGSGPVITSYNPADHTPIASGPSATEEQIDRAIAAARNALSDWSLRPIEDRIEILKKAKAGFEKQRAVIAEAISREVGKPLWDADSEAASVATKFDISIEAFKERCPEKNKTLPIGTVYTRHKPHGVMAVYGPFNFPAHLPNGHILPAVLAGNTVVFKPSELTPFVGELYVKIWEEAGIPPGVINLIQGDGKIGKALSEHPGIDGILFTGSWNVGQKLLEASSRYPKRIVALELGGNNPIVVHEAADKEAAAIITIQSSFLSAGQRCTCARRLMVPKSEDGDKFIERLVEKTKNIVVGAYTSTPEPFIGPLINAGAAQKVYESYKAIVAAGGVPLVEMKSHGVDSAFLSPGIVDVTNVTSIPDDEIFGPLLLLRRTENFEKAIEEANNTAYGLVSAIITDNPNHFKTFWQNIRAGVVNWNSPSTGATSYAPFGGLGKSGNYRPSGYYACDYTSYPVASTESPKLKKPEPLPPGLS